MADTPLTPEDRPEPPKIRLGGSGNSSANMPGDTAKLSTGQVIPPKIRLRTTEKKTETSRIDLASAKPPPPPTPPAEDELREPTPLQAGEFYKKSTIRIETKDGGTASDTQKIKTDTHRMEQDATKQQTIRVDMSESAKAKSDTTKLDLPPKDTARIGIGPQTSRPDDIITGRAMPTGVIPALPKGPPTQVAKPKTIGVRPPGSIPPPSTIQAPPGTAEKVAEAKKGETARIAVPIPPAGAEPPPPTRPKTIRIKRPDSAQKKTLTIARPGDEPESRTFAVTERAEAAAAAAEVDDDEPGALVGVAALFATLISAVLVYVLAAQTIATNLPFAGRM